MSILLAQPNPGQTVADAPIIAQTTPPTGAVSQIYDIGQVWIDTSTNVIYTLTSFSNGLPFWSNSISGGGTFASLTVTPGPTAITGEFRVNGNVNEANVISLNANAGASETVLVQSTQGTGAGAVKINAASGGIEVNSVLNSNFTVTGASQDLTLSSIGGSVVVAASEGAPDAIVISASTGGIEATSATDMVLTSSTGDIDMVSTLGDITITSDTLVSVSATGSGSSVLIADNTNVSTIDLGNISPAAARITTIAGGAQITAHTDLVSIADGGVSTSASAEKEVTIATGGTAVGTTLVNIATGAVSAAGTTNLNMATGAAPAGTTQVVNIGTGGGGGTKQVNLGGASDYATAINAFGPMHLNDGVSTATTSIGNTGNGGSVAIASHTTVNIDALATSHITVTGAAADLNLNATGGSVNVSGTEAIADAITLTAANGGIEISTTSGTAPTGNILISSNGGGTVNVGSSGNTGTNDMLVNVNGGTSSKLLVNNATGTGTGSITVNSAVGGILVQANAALENINLNSALGSVTLEGNAGAAGDIALTSTTAGGGITALTSSGGFNVNLSGSGPTTIGNAADGGAIALTTNTSVGIDAKEASHFTVTGANNLTLSSTAGEVVVTSSKASDAAAVNITAPGAASGITLNASDALGTILLTTGAGGGVGGLISVANNTVAGAAGPSATVATTNNTRVGKVTYAGYTQAAAATLVITLTNSFITLGSVIFASMTDASTNATLMTLSGITVAAGSAVLTFTNNGSQAVNGNLQLNFWVLS